MDNSKLIIYEDDWLIAVHKPAGLATQTSSVSEKDLVNQIRCYLGSKGKNTDIGLINRLDQPVEGIVLFGITKKATAYLSDELINGGIDKHYYAAVSGIPAYEEGKIADYVIKEEKGNMSRIVEQGTPGAKKALLEYKLLRKNDEASLLDVHLITGRHHQIRLQMAGAGMPVLGDRKYGDEKSTLLSESMGIKTVALCAYSLSFEHPQTGERMTVTTTPEGRWYTQF